MILTRDDDFSLTLQIKFGTENKASAEKKNIVIETIVLKKLY